MGRRVNRAALCIVEGRSNDLNTIQFSDAFSDYLVNQRARDLSDNYLALQRLTAEYWRRRHGDGPLAEITPAHIRAWLLWLAGKERDDAPNGGMSSSSVDIHYRNMKAFWLWCEAEEYVDPGRAPIRKVERPKLEEKIPDALTPAEVTHLLRKVRTNGDRNAYRDYCLHLFFAVTCVRLEELAGLTWDDLNLEQGYAKVKGKGRKERLVPLSPALCKALVHYRRKWRQAVPGENAVFTSERGLRLDRDGIRTIVVRDLRAYVPRPICKIGPHTWRRTGITMLLDSGVGLADVKDIAGHTDISTTLRYRKKAAVQVVTGMRAHPVDEIL